MSQKSGQARQNFSFFIFLGQKRRLKQFSVSIQFPKPLAQLPWSWSPHPTLKSYLILWKVHRPKGRQVTGAKAETLKQKGLTYVPG